ncbi:C39 family peptidase [Enterococcus hailinensis]|uniref:C39 family peptidase n=1 Tax=Enterococcus hailinensis TaxID=3238988 RepID=UPI0038B3775A
MKRVAIGIPLIVIAVIGGGFYFSNKESPVLKSFGAKQGTQQEKNSVILDVPLENQFDDDALENGCEVTALSMLLQFYGYDTNKNELVNKLAYQPLYTESGNHGNPHLGFVGDITGGDEAMGVAVEPIADLAKEYVAEEYDVITKEKAPFNDIIDIVAQGIPVWIVATVEFQVPTNNDFMLWNTDQGEMYVTPLIHAAVITGFDREKEIVYVNDPNGYKNRAIAWSDLKEIYEQMDQQSLYLEKQE